MAIQAVPDDIPEEIPAETTKTVSEAAASGTQRELLEAMRARIAKTVESDSTPARDLAALTKRLVEVVRDIEALDVQEAKEAEEHERVREDEAFDAATV